MVADNRPAPEDALKLPPPFDVNEAQPQEKGNKFLHRYTPCFCLTHNYVTALAKHQITTENGARVTRQSSYHFFLHERKTNHTHVK